MDHSEIIKEIQNISLKNLPTTNFSNIKDIVSFGIIEKFFFDKLKPDKNNFYSNLNLIKQRNKSFKEIINYIEKNQHVKNTHYLIMFKELKNNWNFLLLKVFKEIDKENFEKYLILL